MRIHTGSTSEIVVVCNSSVKKTHISSVTYWNVSFLTRSLCSPCLLSSSSSLLSSSFVEYALTCATYKSTVQYEWMNEIFFSSVVILVLLAWIKRKSNNAEHSLYGTEREAFCLYFDYSVTSGVYVRMSPNADKILFLHRHILNFSSSLWSQSATIQTRLYTKVLGVLGQSSYSSFVWNSFVGLVCKNTHWNCNSVAFNIVKETKRRRRRSWNKHRSHIRIRGQYVHFIWTNRIIYEAEFLYAIWWYYSLQRESSRALVVVCYIHTARLQDEYNQNQMLPRTYTATCGVRFARCASKRVERKRATEPYEFVADRFQFNVGTCGCEMFRRHSLEKRQHAKNNKK